METRPPPAGKLSHAVVSLPMRDGNRIHLSVLPWMDEVVSLPMRDGNEEDLLRYLRQKRVVSLPMRDGNGGCGSK